MMLDLFGMQTGFETQAFWNTMPEAAMLSMFGVRTTLLPIKPV